ncbi:CPBP family glutamic-type intramembrane protease [Latilactobacillus sakei]
MVDLLRDGWILGATYYWTKDLKCSMVLHALINLL